MTYLCGRSKSAASSIPPLTRFVRFFNFWWAGCLSKTTAGLLVIYNIPGLYVTWRSVIGQPMWVIYGWCLSGGDLVRKYTREGC